MADQSEETMEEEEMAGQSQEESERASIINTSVTTNVRVDGSQRSIVFVQRDVLSTAENDNTDYASSTVCKTGGASSSHLQYNIRYNITLHNANDCIVIIGGAIPPGSDGRTYADVPVNMHVPTDSIDSARQDSIYQTTYLFMKRAAQSGIDGLRNIINVIERAGGCLLKRIDLNCIRFIVRFYSTKSLDKFKDGCLNGKIAQKLTAHLITDDEIRKVSGEELKIQLTIEDTDYREALKKLPPSEGQRSQLEEDQPVLTRTTEGSDQECVPPKIPKLDDSFQAATSGRSLQPKTPGSDQECSSPKIPKLEDSSQAATSGRSLQPKTTDDMSQQGAQSTKHPAQVAAESCREALKTHYRTTGSYVRLIPWMGDDTKHIKDIFTDLTMENSGKKLESYQDVFLQKTRDGDPIKRVILKGLPGRGKSTIVDKMAYDWACDEALQEFELVFVLRMSAVEQTTQLIDSIFEQLLAEDTKTDKVALGSFIKDNEEKVLILLDGFDELQTPTLDKALFGSILKILNRKEDRECYVVVTTRPSHYDKLVDKSLIQKPFTQVRVEGFDKEDIKKYVQRFYSEEHGKAEGLLQKIKSSNVLSDLAKSPMLLLLMCILWRDNSTLPETMSRIYSEALEYIIHRKTDDGDRPMPPDEISKVTNELGKIGLHGLLAPKQQLAFPEEVFEPSVLELAIKAGILTSQKVLKGLKSHNSIQFLHKTFQEFCAGKYLQSLLETDKVEFQKNLDKMTHFGLDSFEYVLRFCAGDNMACTSSIVQTLAESNQLKKQQNYRERPILVQLGLNCYFEGQSKDLPPVEFIQSVLTDKLIINDWNSDSLNSLTYFLQTVHTYTMENKQTDYLDKLQSITILDCQLGGCMSDLAHCMSLMVNLSSLTLSCCTLNDSSEEYAATPEATSNPVSSAASWAHHFKKMKNLQKLHFIECSLIAKDMTHIAPALCDLPNLVQLNLWGNETLGGSAASWAYHFKKMKNLQKLYLTDCSLTGKDMTHIGPVLCDLPNLVELNLAGNRTLGGSAASWAHHFKKMKNLQWLHFGQCSLTGEDKTHISHALPDSVDLHYG